MSYCVCYILIQSLLYWLEDIPDHYYLLGLYSSWFNVYYIGYKIFQVITSYCVCYILIQYFAVLARRYSRSLLSTVSV